jgi:hypothetical protein
VDFPLSFFGQTENIFSFIIIVCRIKHRKTQKNIFRLNKWSLSFYEKTVLFLQISKTKFNRNLSRQWLRQTSPN